MRLTTPVRDLARLLKQAFFSAPFGAFMTVLGFDLSIKLQTRCRRVRLNVTWRRCVSLLTVFFFDVIVFAFSSTIEQ